jgi:GH15 family glucan-1,4-alpha-glucosidase
VRSDRQHFTHSKVMAWVAADRMARAVRTQGLPGLAVRWERLRDQIHQDVTTHAFDAGRNTFTQAYGSSALDASPLLIPRVGPLPGTDPQQRDAISLFEKLLRLLSEEWDPAAQRQLGNTPQAFSHFALVISALQLHSGTPARSDHPMRAAGPTDNAALYHDEH